MPLLISSSDVSYNFSQLTVVYVDTMAERLNMIITEILISLHM